ncbi:hypothetical protein [Oleiharenicola lentus]|uniref:hypothetical protein n=1 Tax=Oleiharenicola lentus TaxID=2508720 RepID=UPI003F670BF1
MNPPASVKLQEDLTLLSRIDAGAAEAAAFPWGYAVAGAAVLLLVVAWAWWRRAKVGVNRELVTRRAADVAVEEIKRWLTLPDGVEVRRAVGEVSAALRRYLEARYAIHAPTLTTEEFWREQAARAALAVEHAAPLAGFTATSDLIKYAGAVPTREQFEALAQSALGFVRETRLP